MSTTWSRRCFQLSLRSLFLLMLVVAVFFAGYSLGERNAQREALQRENARKQLRQVSSGIHIYHDSTATSCSTGESAATADVPSGSNDGQTRSFFISFMR